MDVPAVVVLEIPVTFVPVMVTEPPVSVPWYPYAPPPYTYFLCISRFIFTVL